MKRLRGFLAVIVALTIVLGGAAAPALAAPHDSSTRSFFVTVPVSPASRATVRLDAQLFTPRVTPAPAVLLAHGFGQTKAALAPEARRLQQQGYVVLTYTARGFGQSGGHIGLDSLTGEVPDARRMVDVLVKSPVVERRAGRPVVGVVGGSYGGALALMLGATDTRIDTVVAAITWNNLADALAPPSAGTATGTTGTPLRDFKVGWASRLFAAGLSPSTGACGRFTPAFCDLYQRLVTGRPATAADLALLAQSSPSTVLDGMRAPTLLLQGIQDRLFGLDQADANERQLKRAGAPVQVRWFNGGHDGGGIAGTNTIIDHWLAQHLKKSSPVPSSFTYSIPASATSFAEQRNATRYPGLDGTQKISVRLQGAPQSIVNPPGGQPASVTGLPGVDANSTLGRGASGLLTAGNPPSEVATFTSPEVSNATVLAGTPKVRLRVTPESAGSLILYAQLSVRTGDATRALPGGVAPIRITLPKAGGVVNVALPATTWNIAPGDHLVLTVRTSDTQFLGTHSQARDTITVSSPLSVPTVTAVAASQTAGLPSTRVLLALGIAILTALVLLLLTALRNRRIAQLPPMGVETGPPLQIDGLVKKFSGGFTAVDQVSFTVDRGQILGLLGENGAGKTTTLRMVAGLLQPDAGTIHAFGIPLGPDSPALDRIGCFIEGPGFLSHLSGRRNLVLYWAATGRPSNEAHLEEVLAVADLGSAINKKVSGYSQGMRQRLAIAQAMLGLPDLLILDEPTNGLDPPQITALRGVLKRYADAGRTVVVSSHLLGEIEKICSHVVVMSHGQVKAAGTVEDVAGDASELLIGVTDVTTASSAALRAGALKVDPVTPDTIRVQPGSTSPQILVNALVHAGVGVTSVTRGRHLEEAFLELIGATEPSS